MFKVYEVVNFYFTKKAAPKMVKLLAEVSAKFQR